MYQVRFEFDGGGIDRLGFKKSQESYRFNKQWTATIWVDRDRVTDLDPQEGADEVYLEVDGVDEFGGILRDIIRENKSTSKLIIDSFERYARRSEPTAQATEFGTVDDTSIVENAISRVPQLSAGTVENIKSGITLTFDHVSPARMIRITRDVTKGELAYNPDKTVDYVGRLGEEKDVVVSPSYSNVEDFKATRTGGSKNVNHLRMLGGGSGDAQVVINVIADSYEQGDEEVWNTYSNREISNSDTLREHGRELINEMSADHIEVKATVRDLELSLGDTIRARHPEENVDARIRVTELDVNRDAEGTYYEITASSRNLSRYAVSDKVVQDVERFNRSGAGQVVSTYDNPTNAPQEEGNIIYVTGANTNYERGLYFNNGSGYEGTQYPDVDADHVYASDSFIAPVGQDQSGEMVLPVGTDKYETT